VPPGATILTVQGISKSFGTRSVLRDVSFAVQAEDRIGLIGVNGGGKSTLMKMLVAGAGSGRGVDPAEVRALEPDDGKITWRRDLELEYVAQEPRLEHGATIAETLARGGTVAAHEVAAMADALRLPGGDATVDALSIGERRRVALGRALLGHADLIALDEPTNHLDARTVEWLEERLRARPGALLLVTHDRYFLDRVAGRILELDRGGLFAHEGDYTSFLERQAERLANESERERARASFVRRELEWIRRGPAARTTKQQARIDRFDAAVAARPGADQRPTGPLELELPRGPRLGKTILDLKGVGRSLGGKRLFRDLTLTMKPGDRIGIVGDNGAGKTTLVRTLMGQATPDVGEVVIGVNTQFAYLDQGRAELDDDKTVLAEVAEGNDHVHLEAGPVHVRTFLRMMLFPDAAADTRIGDLSGGERNRVQLTKLLRRGGNVLVLDEPTNDLDLVTLGVLEQSLLDFPGCALIVSHDRWFLDRVATGILAFEGDGQVVFHEGNFSAYRARRAAELRAKATEARPATASATEAAPRERRASAAPDGPKKLTFKEARELEAIETTIQTAEAKVAELEAAVSDPEIFKSRGAEVPAMIAALDAARAEVERLYARWSELDARPKP
jgi:ATP-binding cassette subfamily F protein uup